jgi:Xaa-Pro aminopeptidase
MSECQLDSANCRLRQQRLVRAMHRNRCDLVVVSRPEHVQWLTGVRPAWVFQAAAAISADGQVVLAAPNREPPFAVADHVVCFEAQSLATLRSDQAQRSLLALLQAIPASWPRRRLAAEFSCFPQHFASQLDAEWIDAEPDLLHLRRQKSPDELAMLRQAITATARMYERARGIIAPGILELEVFSQLQTVAVECFGEVPTATGNDYQCASPGGPPRAGHAAHAGELYILDLGPAYRGYFADNCRTIAVRGVTDEQYRAWQATLRVFELAERTVRPGVSARAVYFAAKEILEDASCGDFFHHLGHGVGLFPHEPPYLNPNWDDCFQEGDVFSVEPGLYSPSLKAGLRIEQNYLVTRNGIELLTPFSIDL